MKTNQREPLTYARVVSCGFSGARPESDEEAYQKALKEKTRRDKIDNLKRTKQTIKIDRDIYGLIAGILPITEYIVASSRNPEGFEFMRQFNSLMHQGHFNDFPYELASLPIVAGLTAYAVYGAIASHKSAKRLDAKVEKLERRK